jgi:DNA-3-methyladenine glycosylase
MHSGEMRKLLRGAVEEVAPALLGCKLIRLTPEGELVAARLVEVEAYHESEPGCHAYRGRTKRNEVMFGRAGLAYVYFVYGMHHCLNIVCGREGEAAAVLVRAAEPMTPLSTPLIGPAVLCRSLAIDRGLNGLDLLEPESPLRLKLGGLREGERIASSKRVGLSTGSELLWRHYLEGNPCVSRGSGANRNRQHG